MRQSAVVIGGASGIGLATAERLLEEGWLVAVVDANEEALTTAEDTLASDDAIFRSAAERRSRALPGRRHGAPSG